MHIQNELFNNVPNLEILVAPVEDLISENPRTTNNNQNVIDCGGVILSKKVFICSLFYCNLKGSLQMMEEK